MQNIEMKTPTPRTEGYLQANNTVQNLEAIKAIVGLATPETPMADVLAVAIDIENVVWVGQIPPYFQIGICVLDTRDLAGYSSCFSKDLDGVISTHSLCVGPEKYCKVVSNQFCFGETEMVPRTNVSPTLENALSDREYAPVFRDYKEDIRFLEVVQMGLKPAYFIDTQQASKKVFGILHNANLRSLVEMLDLPKAKYESMPEAF